MNDLVHASGFQMTCSRLNSEYAHDWLLLSSISDKTRPTWKCLFFISPRKSHWHKIVQEQLVVNLKGYFYQYIMYINPRLILCCQNHSLKIIWDYNKYLIFNILLVVDQQEIAELCFTRPEHRTMTDLPGSMRGAPNSYTWLIQHYCTYRVLVTVFVIWPCV